MPPSPFLIRDSVTAADGQFILGAFDSTLAHLAAIGSGEQWGSQPFSQRPSALSAMADAFEKESLGTGEVKLKSVFIAEVEGATVAPVSGTPPVYRTDEAGRSFLQVGAAILKDQFSDYLLAQPHLQPAISDATRRDDWVFLFALVSDYRAQSFRKGAGAVLISNVKSHVRDIGKRTIYVDCFSGNGRGLVK